MHACNPTAGPVRVCRADVDRALYNTMRIRFELGLFDAKRSSPYWRLGEDDIGSDASKALNYEAAAKSLVLLRNPGVLPLKPGLRIAVIGPHGNASDHLIQIDTGDICPVNGQMPTPPPNPGHVPHAAWSANCVQSPFQAIQAHNSKGTTTYTQGCNLFLPSSGGFDAAVAAAKAADVVVLGLGIAERAPKGDKVSGGDLYLEHEVHDRTSIDLPPVQKNLISRVMAVGKPVVIFYLNAGSVGIPDEVLASDKVALIEAFYPGMEGGRAIADAIFGTSNRWGKLP